MPTDSNAPIPRLRTNQNPFIRPGNHESTLGAVRAAIQIVNQQLMDGPWAEYCILDGCDDALAYLEDTLIRDQARCKCSDAEPRGESQ